MAKTATDLSLIYSSLSSVLKKHNSGLTIKEVKDSKLELAGTKTVTLHNKPLEGVFFAAAMVQKNFVGFYFFPIYTHPEFLEEVPAELKKCLKGKSCFHIKKNDPLLIEQIDETLKKGKEFYRKNGLI